jgi:hypothetical protein
MRNFEKFCENMNYLEILYIILIQICLVIGHVPKLYEGKKYAEGV